MYKISYYYENENGVIKMINKSPKNQKYRSGLHEQRINKNIATRSV